MTRAPSTKGPKKPRRDPCGRRPDVGFDPLVRQGRACLRGTSLLPWFMTSRLRGGDSFESVRKDYDLTRRQMEDAIRWELAGWRTKKRWEREIKAEDALRRALRRAGKGKR